MTFEVEQSKTAGYLKVSAMRYAIPMLWSANLVSNAHRVFPSICRLKIQSLWSGSSGDLPPRLCRTIRSCIALALFALTLFPGISSQAHAQIPNLVRLDNSRSIVDLWPELTVLSDPGDEFTIDDVLAKPDRFQNLRAPYANLGIHRNAMWLRTNIALSENAPLDWWLRIDFAILDEIDLYVVEQGRVVQHLAVRQREAFAKWSFAFHQPVFQLALQPDRQYELVIRVRKYFPNAIYIPLSLVRTSSLIKAEASAQFWRSLMLGVGICFVVYALFIAALKRDPLCIWFALFAACSTLYAAAYYGLANAYLWPNSHLFLPDLVARYCMLLRVVSCFLFVDGVLELREQSPRISLVLRSLAGFFALLIVLFATGLASNMLVAGAFSVIGTLPLLLLVPFVVRRFRDGDALWDWAIVGAACYAAGMSVATTMTYGYLPWSQLAEGVEHLGALLLMTTWIVVMSIRTHRRQRAAEVAAEREREIVAQLAIDLRHQKEIAEKASLSKSRFLAAASHDLRQPVHALSLFVGALRGVPMNTKGQRLLDQIEASTDAMDRLFAALLDISKLDAGGVEIRRQPFAIDAVLIRVCDDFADEATAKGLRLSYVCCRAIVDSDPILVERIARNLISNAVRYTDTGRILIGCRRRGAFVSLQVWDTGRGISPDQQELVFQEYHQVGNPERDREKGLGLGLAIVRRTVDLLECRLKLRSELGRGSCFEVFLPLADSAVTPLNSPDGDVRAMLTTGLVVVVDDERAIRAGMSALLIDWGYEVLAVGSVDEAIQRLAGYTGTPSFLICDLRLRGGENGIDAIEKLRTEYNESIPAILITGDTAGCGLAEAQTRELLVLYKPVSNGKLRAAMARLAADQSVQQKSATKA
ncbi:hybrid sensor histidine kinase/response regulator [Paraburkholderia antibiotica]|uniref:histidine kinase n=1 Tax=Paraburkholderia antibiotica TaxID=2728839 RepID=A0A7X9X6C1_9BURK|nr:hybrid sensor histidine kinase/response regulator [Paraburkholderia antibiotica]NML32323.1 hybrid sensor histidine kinase/response regulator [Paraburkholderia antibiotica]